MVFNGKGCATIVLLYTYTGKEMEKERKREKKKCSWLELNLAPLGCEDSA